MLSLNINSADGKLNYEAYFLKELITAVENLFRMRKSRDYRAIAGFSMGGYGAFNYALKYLELFCAAAPLSAAVFTNEELR